MDGREKERGWFVVTNASGKGTYPIFASKTPFHVPQYTYIFAHLPTSSTIMQILFRSYSTTSCFQPPFRTGRIVGGSGTISPVEKGTTHPATLLTQRHPERNRKRVIYWWFIDHRTSWAFNSLSSLFYGRLFGDWWSGQTWLLRLRAVGCFKQCRNYFITQGLRGAMSSFVWAQIGGYLW